MWKIINEGEFEMNNNEGCDFLKRIKPLIRENKISGRKVSKKLLKQYSARYASEVEND